MWLFKKRSLKRVSEEPRRQSRHIKPFPSEIKTPQTTNVLLGILFTLIIILIKLRTSGAVPSASFLAADAVFTFILIGLFGVYLILLQPGVFGSSLHLISFGFLCLLLVGACEIFIRLNWSLFLIPLPLIVMVISVGYNQQLALVSSLFFLFLVGFGGGGHYFTSIGVYLPAVTLGALSLVHLQRRAQVIRIGSGIGVILAFSILAQQVIISNTFLQKDFMVATIPRGIEPLLGLANGVVSGFLLLGILPVLEGWFGVMTDLSLLELSDFNHPLLKRLSLEAPGTYHHSLRVGDLSEAAAEAIGANPLLARVGAYYHDVGKLNKPEYFMENEMGSENKHTNLSPSMSTLIITAHTKDGLELAKYYRLPPRIQEFVQSHHGTTVVKYFYHAEKHNGVQKTEDGNQITDNGAAEENAFRYPGPKPQSKEGAITLLADPVEAIARTLVNITPGKLKNLVHEIIIERMLDGQLDASALTMWEVHRIEEAFIRTLAAVYHARIKYPEKTENGSK